MVKVPIHPQNTLVEVVQGSVAEPHETLGREEDEPGECRPGAVPVRCCTRGDPAQSCPHPGAFPQGPTVPVGFPLPPVLPTVALMHRGNTKQPVTCASVLGSWGWHGAGGPSWRASARAPAGSGGEGRHSRGWKCAVGSPPTLIPRDLPARRAGVPTSLSCTDTPSALQSRPRLPPRHGLPLCRSWGAPGHRAANLHHHAQSGRGLGGRDVAGWLIPYGKASVRRKCREVESPLTVTGRVWGWALLPASGMVPPPQMSITW